MRFAEEYVRLKRYLHIKFVYFTSKLYKHGYNGGSDRIRSMYGQFSEVGPQHFDITHLRETTAFSPEIHIIVKTSPL